MEKRKLLSLLRRRKSHLLQRVTDKFLRRLSDMCAEDAMLMAENQKVMKEGDDCDPPYLWIVCQGKVDISVKGGILTSVGPGGLVGEFSVVTGLRRRADAFAKEQAVLIKVSADVVRSLAPENRNFLPQLAAEQEALAAFFQEMYPDVSVPHAEVGISPAQVHMPPMDKFLTEKAAGVTSFADNVAAYKRLLRLAIKAKVGTGNLFLFFAPDNHSPHVQLDPYGERASKVKPEGSLLFPSAEGLWGSTMVLPAIDKPAMVFVEFKIELYNPVCELLIGVCDGSQKPANGQVIFTTLSSQCVIERKSKRSAIPKPRERHIFNHIARTDVHLRARACERRLGSQQLCTLTHVHNRHARARTHAHTQIRSKVAMIQRYIPQASAGGLSVKLLCLAMRKIDEEGACDLHMLLARQRCRGSPF